jgi:type VI secretion system protein ImpJ
MLLTPQHFDDLTLRLERLLEHASVTSAPFNWGVFKLAIGETELLNAQLYVSELEAIFPDGLTVAHDARLGGTLALDLNALDAEFKVGPFMVYAAVPAHREGEDRAWRYESAQSREDEVAAGDDVVPIPRLQVRLQLIASRTPPPSRFVSIPLARLQYRTGAFVLLDNYVPPTRLLDKDASLIGDCITLLRRVREVAVVLQQQYRSLSAQERQDMDMARRTAVQQLVAMLPYSEAVLEAGQAHPFTVYTTLCVLAGHVAGISSDPIPPNFARYDHMDLVASYAEVKAYINRVLAENSSTDYLGIPFQHGEGTFYLMFEPAWKGKQLLISMRGEGKPAQEMIVWADQALIGSSILQDSMRQRRILGARRARVEREPGLFTGPDTILYRLGNDDEFIQGGEMLEVSSRNPEQTAGEPAEMMLYIMQG